MTADGTPVGTPRAERVAAAVARATPEQPYGPGAMCETCGHFAGRHYEDGCKGVTIEKGCTCPVMCWMGTAWPRPWLPAPEGLTS